MFKKFRAKIQFLKLIPDELYYKLDLSEFVLPDAEINSLRRELENKLYLFIMTYKSNTPHLNKSKKTLLCSKIKYAELNEKQLDILKNYELKMERKGVKFVAYEKPLIFKKDLKS